MSSPAVSNASREVLGARAVAILRGLVKQVADRAAVRLFVANHAPLANVDLEAKRVLAAWHDLDVCEGRIEPEFPSAFCPECGGNHPETKGRHA